MSPNEHEREIKKKAEGNKQGDQAKIWGAWPTQAPLRIATVKQRIERTHSNDAAGSNYCERCDQCSHF